MSSAGTDATTSEPTSLYGYTPSRVATIILLVLFVITFVLHGMAYLKYRLKFLLMTLVFCPNLEILGWGGRLWSTFKPNVEFPHKVQFATLAMGATPLLAANFFIFQLVIAHLGQSYSRLSPKAYTIVFGGLSLLGFLLLLGGTGMASAKKEGDIVDLGRNVTMGGMIYHIVISVLFGLYALEYLVRFRRRQPVGRFVPVQNSSQDALDGRMSKSVKIVLNAIVADVMILIVRFGYRTIELAQGADGSLAKKEIWLILLDAAQVLIALTIWNVVHPCRMLGIEREEAKDVEMSASL
ncbi:unnamed protein product [Cyclocybe aegerita]|uniref:RTA1-domain-containing protein n=1 Tax=Cyclocybe aegerita TaxID=1973307 RepID=A0A8S0VSW7_CYCAE|nr:unnamed protein product [Cyclocybe aegerita]